jgi:hypothetical protein
LPNSGQKQQDFATKSALVGYARVSKTEGQDLTPQLDALDAAGCRRIYEEKASGGRWDRPELKRLLDHLNRGDVVVVWKLTTVEFPHPAPNICPEFDGFQDDECWWKQTVCWVGVMNSMS